MRDQPMRTFTATMGDFNSAIGPSKEGDLFLGSPWWGTHGHHRKWNYNGRRRMAWARTHELVITNTLSKRCSGPTLKSAEGVETKPDAILTPRDDVGRGKRTDMTEIVKPEGTL